MKPVMGTPPAPPSAQRFRGLPGSPDGRCGTPEQDSCILGFLVLGSGTKRLVGEGSLVAGHPAVAAPWSIGGGDPPAQHPPPAAGGHPGGGGGGGVPRPAGATQASDPP